MFKSGQHADILYSADHCYHCYPDTGDLDDHHSGISGFVCQYVSMLPESIGRLIKLNPITSFVELLRYAVLYDSLAPLKYHAYSIAWCVLVVGFGLYIFNKKQDNFILKL